MSSALHSRLLGILKRELDSKKLQIPPYCTAQLEQMVGHGIQRIRTQKGHRRHRHRVAGGTQSAGPDQVLRRCGARGRHLPEPQRIRLRFRHGLLSDILALHGLGLSGR